MLYTNEAYFSLIGYTRQKYEELIGDDYMQVLFDADRATAENPADAESSDEVPGRQYRIVRRDGSIHWIKMNASIIIVSRRKCVLCFFEDVTMQHQEQSRLALIADSVGSSISLILIRNGVEEIVYANDLFYQLIGISRQDYQKKMRVSEMGYVSAKDKKRTAEAIKKSLQTGRPQELEYRFISNDSRQTRWMCRRLATLKLDEPNAFYMSSIVTDITKWKQTEKLLTEERKNYQNVMDNIPCGLVKVRVDADGSSSPVFVNKAFLKMTDMSLSDMMKLYANDTCAGIHPEDVSRIREMMADFKPGENKTAAFRLRKGRRDWVWVRVSSYIKEEDGVLMLYNSYLDISGDVENAFVKESLLNELPGGVAIFKVGAAYECQYFNDGFAWLSNRNRDELNKVINDRRFFEQIIYKPDFKRFYEEITKQAAGGNDINLTFRFLTRDKEVKWLHLTARKMRMEDGYPVYYCILTYPTDEVTLYRNIVENSTTAVFVAEKESRRIGFINDVMRQLCNLKSANLLFDDSLLLSNKEISALSYDGYQEFHRLYNDRYLAIRAKALSWNGVDSYILYVTDETHEYQKNRQQQQLLNKVPAGIGVYKLVDGVPQIVYMNDGYYHLMKETRRHRENRQKDNLISTVHPDDVGIVRTALDGIVEGQNVTSMHYRIMCGDGIYRWFRMDAMVISRQGQTITGYCAYTDFDETMQSRHLLEQANETVQAQFEKEMTQRRMLEKDSDIVAILNVSQNRLAEYRTLKKNLYIYKPNQSIAKAAATVIKRIPDVIQQQQISDYFNTEKMTERFIDGVTQQKTVYRSRQKDGCLHWMRAICRTEVNKETKNLMGYLFVRDIDAEQKKALATQSAIDAETDFIMLVSAISGRVMIIKIKDAYKDLGWADSDNLKFSAFSNKSFLKYVVKPDLPLIKDIYDLDLLVKRLQSEPAFTVTYRHVLKDGTLRRKKTRVFYMDEMKEDIIIAQRDITDTYKEEQEQKRQLEAASKAKSDFLSNMSHEIRTPMNAIIGMTELTLDKTKEPETKEGLQSIKNSGEYMMSILNDILDMSRIESGQFSLDCSWIAPVDVLLPCIEMIKPAMAKKKISFETPSFDRILPYEYYVDVVKTRRMLMNLLNNACKFTGPGGHISMQFKNREFDDKTATDLIIIQDDGCGMSEDFLKRIFTPFAQERNRYSGSVQGTGLGLALARQTARAMGGDITVESTLGHGSCFTVVFPYRYRLAGPAADSSGQAKSESSAKLKGKHILLCEDNSLNTEIAKRLLQKAGCTVETAANGLIGVNCFGASAANGYDAILMDIRMPEMDGLAAARAIRKLKRPDAATVPIIAMSANAFDEDVKKSLQAGMNDHLAKPVEPQKMYDTLVRLIRQKPQ